jgi:MinD superfamily P-loop ATPase
LSDLKLAVEMIRQLNLRHGVVINRADSGDKSVHDFCAAKGIPVLLEILDDRRIAEAYSRGELAALVLPEWKERMQRLWAGMIL